MLKSHFKQCFSNPVIKYKVLMSLILNRYKNIRRIGGGAFGDVQLVTDENGKQFAIKMISKKMISKEPFMAQYIEGQKQCMIKVKSPYVVQLFDVQEDEKYKYFICEFCDCGDLLSLQARQLNKVFIMKQTIKILSQVLIGLESVHRAGYLHRDIKLQNILVKKDTKGNQIFKIADFGFAKRLESITGTILGTQNYMAPEIYLNEVYSYEVDMWAFGVLFYFMLNMEFPYNVPPHDKSEAKRNQVIKQTNNFSFQAKVGETSKKIKQNCSPEIEDLFKQMMTVEPKKRISFSEIRFHPVFKDHFPNQSKQDLKFYDNSTQINRYDSFRLGRMSVINPNKKNVEQFHEQTVEISPSCFLKRAKTTDERQILELELEKIRFLNEASQDLSYNLNFVQPEQILAFRYNVLKFYIILLKDLYKSLKPEVYSGKYPKWKWEGFFKSNDGINYKAQLKDCLDQAEIKLSDTYDQCKASFSSVKQFNPKIGQIFQREVSETEFTQTLKVSYRFSTSSLFSKLRQKMNISNFYAHMTLIVFLIHAYNNVMKESESELRQIFSDFVKATKCNIIDFRELRGWLSQLTKQKSKNLISVLNKKYFPTS